MEESMSLPILDWVVIVLFLLITMGIGLYFTKRASKNISTFFVSGHSLPWYIAGVSIIATNFASDTPLWVTSLVRQYGIYTIWQFWSHVIGASLCMVYFARLWRRMGIVTDIEFLELRYSGKSAAVLRFWSGLWGAALICPLTIAWVTKAMDTIAREVMGLPQECQMITTAIILGIALTTCVFSGLSGVVYSDFLQFIVAWTSTLILAFLCVRQVGGLSAMVDSLTNMHDWSGRGLDIAPKIGPSSKGMMSIWNIFGYFGFFWIGAAISGGYMAQRLLACKNSKHASYAQFLNTVIYWGLLAWPWIIVALCSLILIPNLGEGVSHDSAYPRMIIKILPVGLRGMLIAGMLAAFISTINTLINWGSSYMINDIYQRFLIRKASDRHYVLMSRLATIFIAISGATISMAADNIQQLLEIFYLFGSAASIVLIFRFFWPRFNAWGEIAASAVTLILTPLLLFGQLNGIAALIFQFDKGIDFVHEYDYLGAKMLFIIIPVTVSGVITSFLTPQTDSRHLAEFVRKSKPMRLFWKRIIREHNIEYFCVETVSRTLISWAIVLICVIALLFGTGKLLLGSTKTGFTFLGIFIIFLFLSISRVKKDFDKEISASNNSNE